MGDKSAIQWTDATWNPTTGCDRVSPGCANCYALTLAPRLKAMLEARVSAGELEADPTAPYMRDGDPKTSGVGFGLMLHPTRLDQPLRWSRPRRVFVNSMSDLFHPEVPDAFLDDVFAVMAAAPRHTFQVLTKRPERMRAYLSDPLRAQDIGHAGYHLGGRLGPVAASNALEALQDRMPWPIPNVWVGTSVENARWRTRIDELRATPAVVRFLSCEPLLGELARSDEPFTHAMAESGQIAPFDLTGIHWVIVGGESGPGARPMLEQWVADIIDACERQGVAVFVKQMGEVWSRENLGHGGHAGSIDEFPADLRIREFPAAYEP